MATELSLKIYNDKKELERDYNQKQYELIQKFFADYMYLKFINKNKYRLTSIYNYDGTYKVIFKDMLNKWTFEFNGINSDRLRWL